MLEAARSKRNPSRRTTIKGQMQGSHASGGFTTAAESVG